MDWYEIDMGVLGLSMEMISNVSERGGIGGGGCSSG
jgi:hypothetical protein